MSSADDPQLEVLLACFESHSRAAKVHHPLSKQIKAEGAEILDEAVLTVTSKGKARVYDPRRVVIGTLTPALTWGVFTLLGGGKGWSLVIWVVIGASMNPAQNRTGSASALSHDSHNVTAACRAAAQLDRSTLLPAPADPTTTVRRWLAPAVSRSCSADLASSVAGSVVGRNFVGANRGLRGASCPAAERSATRSSIVPPTANAEAPCP
jgi:hypothetical protein